MHSEAKLFEALEYIISLSFEVALKSELQKDLEYLGHSGWGSLPFLSSHVQGPGEVSLPLAI